jgi:hypothetical protein
MKNKIPLIVLAIIMLAVSSNDTKQQEPSVAEENQAALEKSELLSNKLALTKNTRPSNEYDSKNAVNNNASNRGIINELPQESSALTIPENAYELGHVTSNARKGRHR